MRRLLYPLLLLGTVGLALSASTQGLSPGPAPLDVGIDEALPRSDAGQMLWPLCRDRIRTTCLTARARAWLA